MNIPIIVTPCNTIGKKRWQAQIADTEWTVSGTDKATFQSNLLDQIRNQGKYLRTRKYIYAGDAVFCLYYAGGWQYEIVRKDNAHCPSVTLLSHSCTEREAIEAFQAHAKQYAEQFA